MHTARLEAAILRPESNEWVRRFAMVGYAVKGAVHALIGFLAIQVALGQGGELAGEHEAVQHVQGLPFGGVALVVIGVGLLGYALWRALEGILDVRRVGSNAKGIAQRVGYVASGVVNAGVAVFALELAFGSHRGGEPKTWITQLMREPGGLVVLGLIGASVVIAGFVQIYLGYTRKFLRELQLDALRSELRRWTVRFGRVGHVARGAVFVVIGTALVRAALTTNPREAKGFAEALAEIASQSFGMVLLALVATGLFAYGAFLMGTAKYRKLGPQPA
jgi:hypothetical protein